LRATTEKRHQVFGKNAPQRKSRNGYLENKDLENANKVRPHRRQPACLTYRRHGLSFLHS